MTNDQNVVIYQHLLQRSLCDDYINSKFYSPIYKTNLTTSYF